MSNVPGTPGSSSEIHFVAVDQSHDALQRSIDEGLAAANALATETIEGGWLQKSAGWVRNNIWRGSLARDYNVSKYSREAQQRIQEGGIDYDVSNEDKSHYRAIEMERFTSEGDDFYSREAGESREQLDDSSDIARSVKDLVGQNATGALSDRALEEEATRLINEYYQENGSEMAKRGLARVNNILEVAAAVKGATDHGESLDNVLANMKVSFAESRSGVRTESNYSRVEEKIDQLSKTKFGQWAGVEAIIAGTSIAAGALGAIKKTSTGSILTAGAVSAGIAMPVLAIPIGLAAGWSALRERKRIKDDRTHHMREMAQGGEVIPGSKRRDKFEETRYNTERASDITASLNARFKGGGVFGENYEATDRDTTLRDVNEALLALSMVEDRVYVSDSRGVDLITYSSRESVREERLELDKTRSEAKSIAQARLEADADLRELLGITDSATLDDLMSERAREVRQAIEGDISEKDRIFGKLRRRSMVKAGTIGAGVGLVMGGVGQEVFASISDNLAGASDVTLGGENPGGDVHATIPAAVIDSLQDSHDTVSFGDSGELHLSHDLQLDTSEDGIMSIIDRDGSVVVGELELDEHGYFTSESIESMEAAGLSVEDISQTSAVETVSEVGLQEYLAMHDGETVDVTRELHFHNDTPTFSDGNELRLLWGGEGSDVGIDGTGITEDGSYQLSVASMIPGESSVNGVSPEWPGDYSNLKFFVSASVDGQAQPFQFDVNPDGTIDIPADHPAAQFFRVDDSGSAEFIGKYAEVAQVSEVDADGTAHISPLATAIGTDEAQYGLFPGDEHQPEYVITGSEEMIIDPPPIIPIVPRQSLESIRRGAPRRRRYDRYYGAGSPEDDIRRRNDLSPRLAGDPDAVLNPHEELEYYRRLAEERRGGAYIREVESAIATSPELSNLPANLETMITIPVNAAGKAESDTIYGLLQAYAGQDSDRLERNAILLHVNWFDDAMGDPAKRALIDHTKSEIERARRDFPHLRIATVETEWERSSLSGGVIGHVARKMNDTALIAIKQAMDNGQIPPDQEVLLIRNDADALGVHRDYLKNFASTADRYDETDIFHGNITLDVSKAQDLPGMVAAATFERFLKTIQVQREGYIFTEGRNFGVRASTLAAVGSIGFGDYTGAASDDLEVGWRIKAARGGGSTGGGYTGYGDGSSGGVGDPSRRISRMAYGAVIDSDSSRQEAYYRRDRSMFAEPWSGFDDGGYKDRDEDLDSEIGSIDDLRRDPDAVIERVRMNMEAAMRGTSEASVRSALAFTMMGLSPGSTAGYTLSRNDSDGSYSFQFTEDGRRFMVNRLQRDLKGRYDSYYNRKMRRLYNQVSRGSRRRPKRRQSQLIKVT